MKKTKIDEALSEWATAAADTVRKKKPAADTTQIKRALDADKTTRSGAIQARKDARADSTSNATVARLMAREGVYGDQPAQLREAANRQGAAARAADKTVAESATRIAANKAALDKARKGGK